MKKILSLTLTVCMLLTLAACDFGRSEQLEDLIDRAEAASGEAVHTAPERTEPADSETAVPETDPAAAEMTVPPEPEPAFFRSSGNLVAGHGGLYYWKYDLSSFESPSQMLSGRAAFCPDSVNTLVCQHPDGTEEELLRDGGSGVLALSADRIFYSVPQKDGQICSCSLSGEDPQSYDAYGRILWYDEESGEMLLWKSWKISVFTPADGQIRPLSGKDFLGCSDRKAYIGGNDSGAPAIFTYSFQDDSEQLLLSVPSAAGGSYITRACFSGNRLYFGIGTVAGTGMIFQGGEAMSAGLNGGDLRSECSLSGGGFRVEEDGSVSDSGPAAWATYARDDDRHFIVDSGTVYGAGLSDTEPEPLLRPEDFENLGLPVPGTDAAHPLAVSWAEKCGPADIYAVLIGSETEDASMVTPTYQVQRVLMVHRNTDTGLCEIVWDTDAPIA